MKRTLAALVLSGGAALALTPVVAHADEAPVEGPPITQRVGEIVADPGQAMEDTKTAVGTAASVVGSSTKATDTSLAGAGSALDSGLPKSPKAG
ncbi:hypothetical protein ABZX75_08445 [Streptomyces sp. NPDC003038]|uniref:hypothetical protein n=1 Tax=unclassified Streptomyces TaxID=2593676 RepID=UPI0033B6C4DA